MKIDKNIFEIPCSSQNLRPISHCIPVPQERSFCFDRHDPIKQTIKKFCLLDQHKHNYNQCLQMSSPIT